MAEKKHYEIERKYLIRRPDPAFLAAQPGCRVWDIVQTYLVDGAGGETRRVRRVTEDGETRYYRTFKRPVTAVRCEEDEALIDEAAYERYAREADPASAPVAKTRYRIPYRGRTLEFDIYPFWTDRAILEVELGSESEIPELPAYVRILRDVTGEQAYRNRSIARRVPMEEIEED